MTDEKFISESLSQTARMLQGRGVNFTRIDDEITFEGADSLSRKHPVSVRATDRGWEFTFRWGNEVFSYVEPFEVKQP